MTVQHVPGSLSALGNRSFRFLFAARTVSVLGNAMAPIALAFAVLALHGATAATLGLVLFGRAVAEVVFLMVAGVVADRLPRYKVMVAADLVAGGVQVAVAVLFLTGSAHVGTVVALEAVNGAATAFFFPASTGLVPQVVPVGLLQSANAVLRLSINSSTIVGAAIAGALVATVGPGWALLVDALSFFVSAALLSGIRTDHTARAEPSSMLADLRHGWREFASRQWVWVIVVQFSIINACFAGCLGVLGPIVAKKHLGGAPAWSAIIASVSVGLLVGSVLALRIRPTHPMRIATLSTFAFATLPLLMAGPAPLWVMTVAGFAVGICSDIFGVLWDTGLQTLVPQESLSRVSSYDALGSFALGPIGLATVGPVADAIGIRETLIGAGVLTVLCCSAALLSPQVRDVTFPEPDISSAGSQSQ